MSKYFRPKREDLDREQSGRPGRTYVLTVTNLGATETTVIRW